MDDECWIKNTISGHPGKRNKVELIRDLLDMIRILIFPKMKSVRSRIKCPPDIFPG
jgi:hypothetical protein